METARLAGCFQTVLIFCLRADFVLRLDSEPRGCESSQPTGAFNINPRLRRSVERVSSGQGTSKRDNYRLVTAPTDGISVRTASHSEPVACGAFRDGSAAHSPCFAVYYFPHLVVSGIQAGRVEPVSASLWS